MGTNHSATDNPSDVLTSFPLAYFPEIPKYCEGIEKYKFNSLKSAGFTKGVCPFGVLIVGTDDYPGGYLQYAANIVANLLDSDSSGKVDLQSVHEGMATENGGVYLAGGMNQEEEDASEDVNGFTYAYGL